MIQLRSVLLVLACLIATQPVSAHAMVLPDPEPATPVGNFNVTPAPSGAQVTLTIVPSPLAGVWYGFLFINGEPVGPENLVLVRDPAGGCLWENGKTGPRTGLNGGGTIRWDTDHHESEVTQGDNAGMKRKLTPMT